MLLDVFSKMNLQIPLNQTLLIGLFFGIFALWVIHMIVIRYHWNNYGNNKLMVVKMNFIYFIGSALLFIAMALFIAIYSTSGITS
jgi:hypothetical protein